MTRNSDWQLDQIRKILQGAKGTPSSPLSITTSDGSAVDSFGRFRISSPFTIIDSKQIVDKQPLFWDDSETSGGGTSSTYNTNQASTTIAVSDSTAGTRVRQTFRRFNYQPGKSQQVLITFNLGEAVPGVIKRVGLFDENNGLFLQLDGDGFAVVVRSNTSGTPDDRVIRQANWNIDRLDGGLASRNPSGITLDHTKTQILIIDFEWLGVGRVRYGFVIDGIVVYCHEVDNANQLALVYMSTPNLPLRYEISNDGDGAAAELVHICSSVASEGGQEETGIDTAVSRGTTIFTTQSNTNIYPLLSIRLKSTHLGITVKPIKLSIICTTSADFRWALYLNPTVGGVDAASWTNVTDSALQFDITRSNTNTLSGGRELESGYVEQGFISSDSVSLDLQSALALGASIAGVQDELVVGVQNLAAGAEGYYAALTVRELL